MSAIEVKVPDIGDFKDVPVIEVLVMLLIDILYVFIDPRIRYG